MYQPLPPLRKLIPFCSNWNLVFPTLVIFLLATAPVTAQDIWRDKMPTSDIDQRIFPKEARVTELDTAQLLPLLWAAPHERELTAGESPAQISVPTPDGQILQFQIVSYDISEAEGLSRYPHIRTWYGQELRNPARTIFLDWTERGFHAIIRGGDQDVIYIDPLGRSSLTFYQSYYAKDFENANGFNCDTDSDVLIIDDEPTELEQRFAFDCDLLQYRTSITCTAEYSNYHDAFSAAQSGLVQSAVVTSVNRINSVFTQDLSLRLLLVANNDMLYYYSVNGDPFTGGAVGSLINQNTPNTNSVIGSAAYDMGHIYTQGANNGVARLRSPCGSSKGAGATSHSVPENDPFNIDYVAHEMGHQLGANHTQNNSCNYSSSAGMEPGSASSIMGYAGICSPNVQNNSDAYFHGRSIEEINNNVENPGGSGNGCATVVNTSLSNPGLVPQSDETIPFGTPFVLKGDASGTDALTYNWEQYDSEQGAMPPQGTNTQGPLFRTFFATSSPERWLPRLEDVVAGVDPDWEEIPMVSRQMSFRLTVRHSAAMYGCTGEDNILLNVDGDHGPFIVTDPANANQWSTGQMAQVQWDVAGTDANNINCNLVDIYLSLDGGSSWNIIASNEPNDGFALVSIGNTPSSQARIMVRAADNVFYNISNQNFTIIQSQGAPDVGVQGLDGSSRSSCFVDATDEVSYQFLTSSSGGAEEALSLAVVGLPAGAVATFIPANPQPGGTFQLLISNMNTAPAGTYNLTLNGTSSEANFAAPLTLIKSGNSSAPGPNILSPPNSATGVDIQPNLLIADQGAASYDYQLSTDNGFNNLIINISASTETNIMVEDYLEANTVYYWRSRGNAMGGCGVSLWSDGRFTTGDCYVYSSSASPVTIPSTAPPITREMSLNIPVQGTITDLDLYELDIQHSWIGDLEVSLVSPQNVEALIMDRTCSREDNIFSSFSDESPTPAANIPCPPTLGDFYQSEGDPLSTFDNQPVNGDWILRVVDRADQDGGSIQGFSIKACLDDFQLLPVSWINYVVYPRGNSIHLEWETAEEVENRGFTIERSSANSRDNWTPLGFVPASRLSRGQYSFEDTEVSAGIDYYYRLRQEDLDGSVNYSAIRSARLDAKANPLYLFPNPTQDYLHYRWSESGEATATYQLLDPTGRIVQEGVIQSSGGSISLEALPAAVYQLRLVADGEPFIQRVVKL